MGGSDAAGAPLLGQFVPPAERGYRVVALVSGPGTGAAAVGADRIVELPFDPASFTTDILALADAG
jgi:hypothetical protein